jgi:hypothetical protein
VTVRGELRAGLIAAWACGLLSCGPSGDYFGEDGIDVVSPSTGQCGSLSADLWAILVPGSPTPPLPVGSSTEVSLFPPLLYPGCLQEVTSVAWSADPPSIVSFEPGESVSEAILTGETPGTTSIAAEITLRTGEVKTIIDDEPILVVSAPGG